MRYRTILLVAAAAVALAACGQVKPGNVGIKVNQYGSGAGVDPTPLGIGTYFTPPGTSIEEFPISTKNYTYTSNAGEQNAANEEFTFQDANGVNMAADIGVNYHVDQALAPKFYAKYRMDMQDFVSGTLRNEIRTNLIAYASTMQVQDIYGGGKSKLLAETQASVQQKLAPFGFEVEQLFWVNAIRVPEAIQDQINARISNENKALAAQAQVATVTAEANQRVAQAQGEAAAIKAQSDALHTSPEYVQFLAVQKWDGHLPTYTSNGPLPFIGKEAAAQ
jgi:regulator of protease activity HflC (stomatin/prohibitin superfamily)